MGCTGVKRNTREEGKDWPITTPYRVTAFLSCSWSKSRGGPKEESSIVIAFD